MATVIDPRTGLPVQVPSRTGLAAATQPNLGGQLADTMYSKLPNRAGAQMPAPARRQGLAAATQPNLGGQLADTMYASLPPSTFAQIPVAAPSTAPTTAPVAPAAAAPAPVVTPVAEPVAPLDVASLNRQVAERIELSRPEAGILQPAERGNYNQYNTDQAALAQRAAPTNGINFGFGPDNTARDYLDAAAVRDAQAAEQAAQRRTTAQNNIRRSQLTNAAQSDDVNERRVALQSLAALDAGEQQGASELANTGRARINLQGQMEQARTAGDAAVQAAQLRSQGTLAGAALGREATLEAARIKASGGVATEQAKATSPTSLLAAQRAQGELQRQQMINDAMQAGDIETAIALAGGGRASDKAYTDPITGAPLSPEAIFQLQQRQLQQLQGQ